MKEIKPPTLQNYGYKATENSCPFCGGDMMYGTVGCPDGRIGCLVCHYGYVCTKCGKQFTP